jgi:hypothetical protein
MGWSTAILARVPDSGDAMSKLAGEHQRVMPNDPWEMERKRGIVPPNPDDRIALADEG